MIVAPDPGYFMKSNKEKEVSEQIIKNGYILLTEEVANIYGSGFKKASISLENFDMHDIISNYDGEFYINMIKNTSKDYCTDLSELKDYGFDLDIPSSKKF